MIGYKGCSERRRSVVAALATEDVILCPRCITEFITSARRILVTPCRSSLSCSQLLPVLCGEISQCTGGGRVICEWVCSHMGMWLCLTLGRGGGEGARVAAAVPGNW